MEKARWKGWRWVLLVLFAGLFFISLGLFNHYRQIEQVKQTGKPISVRVIDKRRLGGKSPNELTALYGRQPIRIRTYSKSFFRNSEVGQTVTVLKRPDIDLYVPSTEPTIVNFIMIVVIWGAVIGLTYGILTNRLS